jgi:DNA-binding NarL/FixJ family response regulator
VYTLADIPGPVQIPAIGPPPVIGEVCREVRSRVPGVACLMFTAFSDDQALLDSILAGVAGYVLKQVRGCGLR